MTYLSDAGSQHQDLFERAQRTIPGGVNSPVRAFRSVGGVPRFVERAQGPYFWDIDGRRYIDYIGSWGPMILGHADDDVTLAVQQAATRGLSYGAPTRGEVEIAERLTAALPGMDMVRFVSSGTEATMSAIRLARGFTQRSKIIKFEGCYHGHADSLLVKAGSGLLTLGNPTSAGVPAEFAAHTWVLEFNNLAQLEAVFQEHPGEIACIIVEPVAGNMNLIRPLDGYLERMSELCTQDGALLIFDEVMTGFRVGPQGVQGLKGIRPDLTTLGKVIGGGMPMGAFGGRRDVMEHLAPLGGVYQAGTLSGNPIAVAAGLTTLNKVLQAGFYERLESSTRRLAEGLTAAARAHGLSHFCTDHLGSMFGIYFSPQVPTCFADVTASNRDLFNAFFHAMLDQGVYLAPSAYEAGFVSIQHDHAVVDETLAAANRAFAFLANHADHRSAFA